MKHAIIAPVHFLPELSALSDYHLVLCHDMQKYPYYREFYARKRQQGDFIILDNSAHELGEGETLAMLVEAIKCIQPQEVVLPDRLFFGDDTLEGSLEAAKALRKLYGTNISLMGVPQGRTVFEWDKCCEALIRDVQVDTIGISKDYEVWAGGIKSRVERTHSLARLWENHRTNIHLLGWGRKMTAIGELALTNEKKYENRIRGVDSAKPIVYASWGIELNKSLVGVPAYPRRVKGYMELTDLDLVMARHNIDVFQAWASGNQEV